MLYALDHPFSLLVLLVSFVLCITFNGWITALLAARVGQRALKAAGRTRPDPRRHVDPFGAVSGLIGGFGWSTPTEVPRRSAGQVAFVLLTGPVLLLAVGLGLLAGLGAHYGADAGIAVDAAGGSNYLQNGVAGLTRGQQTWFLGGLMATYVGALHLVPLPPLPGGQVLLAAAPRTLGWQKAEYQLVERNIGLVVLLVLMLLPLDRGMALLPDILDNILGPLIRLVSGG